MITNFLARGLIVGAICCSTVKPQGSVPPFSFSPIDSVWITRSPAIGETFTVFVRFSVNSARLDSAMLQASSIEFQHRETRRDFSRVFPCKLGDTITGSVDVSFEKAGQYELYLSVRGWYAHDPSGRPTGSSMKVMRFVIPESGPGHVVDRFPAPVSSERKSIHEGELIFMDDVVIDSSGDTLWPIIIPADLNRTRDW